MRLRIGIQSYLWICALHLAVNPMNAQPTGINFEESKVPDYTLPEVLLMGDGSLVTEAGQWMAARRTEILSLFEEHVYGRSPGRPAAMESGEITVDRQALDGRAIRKEVTLHLEGKDMPYALHVLMYLPADTDGPVPVFIGYNFNGNHTVHADPGIRLAPDSESARGSSASRWPLGLILARGYGLVTAWYGDMEADHPD